MVQNFEYQIGEFPRGHRSLQSRFWCYNMDMTVMTVPFHTTSVYFCPFALSGLFGIRVGRSPKQKGHKPFHRSTYLFDPIWRCGWSRRYNAHVIIIYCIYIYIYIHTYKYFILILYLKFDAQLSIYYIKPFGGISPFLDKPICPSIPMWSPNPRK